MEKNISFSSSSFAGLPSVVLPFHLLVISCTVSGRSMARDSRESTDVVEIAVISPVPSFALLESWSVTIGSWRVTTSGISDTSSVVLFTYPPVIPYPSVPEVPQSSPRSVASLADSSDSL